MGYGLTNHLLAVCGGAFCVSFFIASRRLPRSWAAALAAIRALVPFVYFAWYFDGDWTYLDDWVYVEHGQSLLDQGFTPLNVLDSKSRDIVATMTGSWHVLYSWWNLVVMWFFGVEYYVPVFVNVAITFCSGHLLAELAKEVRFSPSYARLLQVFYLLHWDTIAWSSLINVKDVLVQLMTIALFLFAIQAVRRRAKLPLVMCATLLVAFMHLRFYVPFVIGAAAAAWVFLEWRDFRKYPLVAGGLLLGLWMLPGTASRLWESMSWMNVAYGIGRFTLTPQPWDVENRFSFLYLPATMHWLMILPAIFGGLMLWRDSRTARLVLIYSAALIVLYGMADEIQGPRQRSQLSYVFAWMQVHFLWRWTHTPSHRSVSVSKLRIEPRKSTAQAA